jgi:hypothetical protein
MSTLTLGTICNTVEKKLQDESNVDYSQAELIGLYNLTIRLIVSLVPKAYTKIATMKCVSGIQQSLPSNGLQLVRPICNMGTDGTTVGAPILPATLERISLIDPDWTTATASTTVELIIPMPDTPATFFCYPASPGTNYIKIQHSATPPGATYDGDGDWQIGTIALSDEYSDAIINGMLYMAYDVDTDIPGTADRSQLYYNRFMKLLGFKSALNLGGQG